MANDNSKLVATYLPHLEWLENEWAKDHKMQRLFPIPYPKKEVFRWFINHIFGPSKRRKKHYKFLRQTSVLNEISTVNYKIGFVGDIMKMFQYYLVFDQSVIDFFQDVELIIGNLEGILTLQPGFIAAQRHNKEITEQLKTVKPAKKWLLCLSNNHSGDFGLADFVLHLDRLRFEGFNVFGRKDMPCYTYDNRINFVSGSMWSNQNRCEYVTRFKEIEEHFISDPKIFNVLYPHWYYEYELYPRLKVKKKAETLLERWDLIFGHHPHVVQPITKAKRGEVNKLLAYSAGNFTAGLEIDAHKYGIIMKCEIGPLKSDSSKLAVGRVEWKFTYIDNNIDENKEKYVKFKKNMPKPEDGPIIEVKIVEENEFLPNINYMD
jgi:hypothetical protein